MKILAFLKRILTKIPGFRRMSSSSMVIAATWYGVAFLTMARYWHWGLVMLALPFLLFNLADRAVLGSTRHRTAISVAAGLFLLAGMAGGLVSAAWGARVEQSAVPSPSPAEKVMAAQSSPARASQDPSIALGASTKAVGLAPEAKPDAMTGSPLPSAMAALETAANGGIGQGEYAYVASVNSDVFHDPDCASARQIKPENIVGYHSRQEAVDGGLRPCKKCKP